jgi:hypothetical protein
MTRLARCNAPGARRGVHGLRQFYGRRLDADRDIRRHDAGQRDQIDAAFARNNRSERAACIIASVVAVRSAAPSQICQ